MFAPKYFAMNVFALMPIQELTAWLTDTATLQEAHAFHGANWPDWVPGSARFRELAQILTVGQDAAKNKDREMMRQLEEHHAHALLCINMNASYIVMRSLHEKDEGLLHNVGYVLKDQQTRKQKPVLKTTPMVLKVKNGPNGSIVVTFERDPAAGLYQLQVCKGEPGDEDSWEDKGLHRDCRVTVTDLDPVTLYNVRGRSHAGKDTGLWSKPVSIVVLP